MTELNRDLVPDDIVLRVLRRPVSVVPVAEVEGAILVQTASRFSSREEAAVARAEQNREKPGLIYALGPTTKTVTFNAQATRIRVDQLEPGMISIWGGMLVEDIRSGRYQSPIFQQLVNQGGKK